jgi:hypothetical protein
MFSICEAVPWMDADNVLNIIQVNEFPIAAEPTLGLTETQVMTLFGLAFPCFPQLSNNKHFL